MNVSASLSIGRMIRGYCLEKVLGTGKLTTLYRARTEELWLPAEITVMLFHLPPTFSERTRHQFKTRFISTAHQLCTLRHPSLHPLFGYGEEHGLLYLLFPPSAPAPTLDRRLQRQRRWQPNDIFSLLAPLSSVFDYLHQQGIVYQFFSPANVLLPKNAAPQVTGAGLLQLLLMQGLEELERGEPLRHLKNVSGDYSGRPAYLAPEVIKGAGADPRSDVYSLGVILFELLSGHCPFEGETYLDIAWRHVREPLPSLHALAPHIPMALELVINRALSRDPARRFSSVGELTMAFSHVLNERMRAPAFLLAEQGRQPTHNRRLLAAPSSTDARLVRGHNGPDGDAVPKIAERTTGPITGPIIPVTEIQPLTGAGDIHELAQKTRQLREQLQREQLQKEY